MSGLIFYKDLGSGQGIEVSREGPYEGKLRYPLVEVPSLNCRLASRPSRPYPRCYLDVEATLKVRDALDDERFLYPVKFHRAFDAMEVEDDEGEGLIFPKEGLSLEEIALSFIYSELPIKLTRRRG